MNMQVRRSSTVEPGREQASQPDMDRAALRSGAVLREIIKRRSRSQPVVSEQSPSDEPRRTGQPLDLRPGCVYGVVTRERVDDLTYELREIKARLNYLFSLVAGAIVVDVLLRISGLG